MDKRDYSKIIVVDDTSAVNIAVKEILNENGFDNVETYSDPQEALSAISSDNKPVVVITDYNMPGMNGVELLHKIEAQAPNVKGIVMTANPHDVDNSGGKYKVIDKDGNFFGKIADTLKNLIGKKQ
jgi:DNA-binding NtrC family response regulator